MQKLTGSIKPIIATAIILMAMLCLNLTQADQPAPKLKDVISDTDASTKSAADANTEIKKLAKIGPTDEYDRGVPRTSVEGFIKAARDADYKRASEYLDLRNLPRGYKQSDGPELARRLKVVLDRSLWIDMELLSNDPKGHSDDGLPSYRDLIGQVEVNQKKYDILLQHVPRKDGIYIWKFSTQTVRDLPRLYNVLGDGPVGEILSEYFPEIELLGLLIWQWVFLLLIVLAASLVMLPVVRLISWLISLRKTDLSLMSARFVNGPLYVVCILLIIRHYFYLVHPSVTAQAIVEASTIFIITMTWMLMRLVSIFREFYIKRLKQSDREYAIVLLRPVTTTVKIIIMVLALLVWLDNIGFSVTTVLAGLGIGGIAIALATQKSIENFIGALTLYLAAPVKVGDFCKFGDKKGTVEEIGLRATKLRTLEDTTVTIPNAKFSSMQIENLTDRNQYRFNPTIRLHHETSPDQMRYVLLNVQKLLHAHSMVAESPLRVRFICFGEHSLDIEIHCYIKTANINEYKAIAEDLNLRIMDIIQSAGTSVAIPSSIEYKGALSEKPSGLKQQAEKQVEELRNRGGVAMDLSQQEIDEIKNTIAYPVEQA